MDYYLGLLHEYHVNTCLDKSKPVFIENFIRSYNIDFLNCQKINILEETFKNCNFIVSTYENVQNNASNDNGRCCIVSNSLSTDNLKVDNLSIEKQGETDCCTAQ